MRRFSILALMGLVLALALGLAALRGANDYWAGGLMMATPLAFGIALLGALCGREQPGSGRLGFAVLGGGYFALAFLGLTDDNFSRLPTTKLVREVHRRAAGGFQVEVIYVKGGAANLYGLEDSERLTSTGKVSLDRDGNSTRGYKVERKPGYGPVTWLRSLMPGAVNGPEFVVIGHCLFALLAGLLGAGIAGRFERGRLNGQASSRVGGGRKFAPDQDGGERQ